MVGLYKKIIAENIKRMKICLYLEMYHVAGGRFYKNIGTGLFPHTATKKKFSREAASSS